jgi:hypothetical protein
VSSAVLIAMNKKFSTNTATESGRVVACGVCRCDACSENSSLMLKTSLAQMTQCRPGQRHGESFGQQSDEELSEAILLLSHSRKKRPT